MEKVHQPDVPSSKILNSNCSLNDDASLNVNKFPYGRYCHIVKRPDFDGYGFNLHSEKIKPGQYIGKVDPDSPAEAAGLREGDQIIEVNGVSIGVETHKQVVQRIKAISNEVRLFLIDPSMENIANLNRNVDKSNNKSINNNTNLKNISTMPLVSSCESQVLNAPLAVTTTTSTEKILPMTTTEASTLDKRTSISMVNTKSQSINNDERTKDENDFSPKSSEEIMNNNSFVSSTKTITITNGKSSDQATLKDPSEVVVPPPAITKLPPPPSQSSEQQMKTSSSSQNSDISQSRSGLNLNLTAAEMRAKLLSKKKFDPKNDSVDLKKKFDIIQKL